VTYLTIMSRHHASIVIALAASIAACDTARPDADHPDAPDWLLARAARQKADAATVRAFHDFKFSDELALSGIGFVHRIVDDAGRRDKPHHSDHGTGIAAADVDADGHPDLLFVTQLGRTELWRNKGDGTFEDRTAASGLTNENPIGVGASFADIDNDGDPDLFLTSVRKGNRLFENDGAGRFTDISAAAGVAYSGHSGAALFLDYDRDGLLDLYVTNIGKHTTDTVGTGGAFVGMDGAFYGHTVAARREDAILYRNLGGNRFQDVSRAVGLGDDGWSGEAVVIDANVDGWPDLYLANMQGEDRLLLNRGGRRFEDATARYTPRTPFGSMGAAVLDWNGDRRLDLLVTDMHSDMLEDVDPAAPVDEERKSSPHANAHGLFPGGADRLLFGNALFTATGASGGGFEESSDRAGVETYWPWGPSVGDLNADGWPDLFVTTGMNYPFRYAPNKVLLNSGGTRFASAEFLLGVEPRRRGMTEQPWFMLWCGPGGPDATSANCRECLAGDSLASRVCLPYPARPGRFAVMGALGTRSAVVLDLDGDGDLDVVTNEFNAPPQVLVSDLADRGKARSLRVRLKGTKSNRQGLGAVVEVTRTDGVVTTQPKDGKSGYLSQSDLPLTFGLGPSATVRSLVVRWPSGAVQTVAAPPVPGEVEVVEPMDSPDTRP
jgi:hypothetical protein